MPLIISWIGLSEPVANEQRRHRPLRWSASAGSRQGRSTRMADLDPDITGLEFVDDLVGASSGILHRDEPKCAGVGSHWPRLGSRVPSSLPGDSSEVLDPILDDRLVAFEYRILVLIQRVLDGGEHPGEFFLSDFQRSTDALRRR